MNSELREGEGDAFAVEGLVDGAVHVEEDIPVVGCRDMGTQDDIDAAGIQGTEGREGGRIGEDALVGLSQLEQQAAYAIDIRAILHPYRPL